MTAVTHSEVAKTIAGIVIIWSGLVSGLISFMVTKHVRWKLKGGKPAVDPWVKSFEDPWNREQWPQSIEMDDQ